MKLLRLFCLALGPTAFLGCHQEATDPGQDVSLARAPTAGTVSASAPVHFHPRTGEVTTTQGVSGRANVHVKFSSVEEACLDFAFSSDRLDPGDDLHITVDGSDAGGFFNPGSAPQATRTFCWSQALAPATVVNFLDGKARLTFIALRGGSVALGSVTLRISGSAR